MQIKNFKEFLLEKDIITRFREEERGNRDFNSHAINSILLNIRINMNFIRNKKLRNYLREVYITLDNY